MTGILFDLAAVGHIVIETIHYPGRTIGPVLGSPPAYCLIAAAQQAIRTGLVTRIGNDFPTALLQPFQKAGVDMQGIRYCSRSTMSQLIYDSAGNKEIRFPFRAAHITTDDIPDVYRGSRLIYVCTMEDDVLLENLAEVARMGAEAAIDLGGYGGAHMSKKRRASISDVAAFARTAAGFFNFVKASEEDCSLIFGKETVIQYGRRLLSGKTEAVIITLGRQGSLIMTKKKCWQVPPINGNPIDTTGGGDAFMGGFFSEYLRSGDILQAAIFGSATAICVIEKTGGVFPERMPKKDEAMARIPADIMKRIILQ
ncbi:MAG: carbohydrate kinase family protein [Spirochaetota bacterium]